jgi:DNA polymerase-3 subunit delta'
MAAALNCDRSPGVGCGECSVCTRILRRSYPDVHHVVPEGPLIPVDVIRESVIPEAARSPFEGRKKVFIIEEADRMNEPAQNALLKTLEEPHQDTAFILVSEEEEELLETIRSRCRVVRLEPVSEDHIVDLLAREGAPELDARVAARLSAGDVPRARSLARDEGAAERRTVWNTIPYRLTGSVAALDTAGEIVERGREAARDRERAQKHEVQELAEAMGEGRGTAAARNALAKRHRREVRRVEEETLGEALESLASFYRDVLAVRSGARDAIINLDRLQEIDAWASSAIDEAALTLAVDRCIEARAALPRNANVPVAIESALLELAQLAPPPPQLRPNAAPTH